MTEFGITIDATLRAYVRPSSPSAPYFGGAVFKGEPQALTASGRPMARWHISRSQPPPEGVRNLKGGRMSECVYLVHCYWPLTPLQEAQHNQEDEIAEVLLTLPNDFIALVQDSGFSVGDYTIGGYNVSMITVEDPSPVQREFPFPDSPSQMRETVFEIHARVLEAT